MPDNMNPDTNYPEDAFRYAVRDILGLSWDTRDVAIVAELRRLKKVDERATATWRADEGLHP